MDYMQLKAGPGAVSGEEKEGFSLKAYRKYELARLTATVVTFKPCRVPKFRNLLPLVN